LLARNKLNQIKQEWTKAGALGLSMRLRLFLFLVVLMVTMVLGVIVILLLTGTFTAGLNESKNLFTNELIHISEDVSKQYGQLSVQAVEFSKDLSRSIEKKMHQKGLNVADLQSNPEILEDLLAGEYERALFSLQKTKSSGVFIILDATKNTKIVNSENSRAGLFIKNMEPNILSSSSSTILLLRGFPNIGRKNSIPLHAQWSMEFDITDAPYYQLPLRGADMQTLPLSRLYYWNPAITLPGTSEEVMLCSVPLIDSVGNIFGACGFEVSAMLFKLAHMPDNSTYNRIFCMLAPISKNIFDTSKALFSGGYSTKNSILNDQLLHITESRKSFFSYRKENGSSFVGFHVPVKLYPEGSAFFGQKWAVALMIPAEDISDAVISSNLRLALMFTLLMILGIFISIFLSREYIKPITQGLDIIKSNNLNEAAKTKILEIDDLIEFLFSQNEELHNKGEEKQHSRVFSEFLKNIKLLSPAERSVFNLYVQQYTAKEIAGILCLSINTIKTHNKRIYTKLKVSSREELLLFINMLKEAGKEFK